TTHVRSRSRWQPDEPAIRESIPSIGVARYEERKQSLGGFEIALKQLLLTSVAALLMATSATHARPEFSKTESWKLTLGTWCVSNPPSDDEAYFGIASLVVGMRRRRAESRCQS